MSIIASRIARKVISEQTSQARGTRVRQVIERDASYGEKYIPPDITYKYCQPRKPRKSEVCWGRGCKSKASNNGRDIRAGLPWDSTSVVSASTQYVKTDAAKGRKLRKADKARSKK